MSTPNECAAPKVGDFSWNELVTNDTKASAKFYSSLFGWQPTPFESKDRPADAPPYTLFKTDFTTMGVGGMLQAPMPGVPTQWVPYVVVADADAALAKAVGLGAKALLPVTDIGQVGRIAVIQDPQGATLGLHEMSKQ